MKTAGRLATALVVSLGGVAAVAAPASAATPALTLLTSGPVAPDASVSMIGVGCPASSPVSIDLWDTSKPGSHLTLNSVRTASSTGSFGYVHDLDDHFDAGAEIGIYFSCTATVDWTWDPPSEAARRKYIQTTIADPQAEIVAPASGTYGVAREVRVYTDAVIGNAVLTVDGVAIPYADGSHYGAWRYLLPATLGVGTHALQATWTPSAPGSPTVTDTATVRITTLTPGVGLAVSPRSVKRTKRVAVRVRLTGTRVAPRTGRVVLKDGTRVVGRLTLRPRDAGTRVVRIRLPRTGMRRITATYAGSSTLSSARSAVVRVRVRR